MTVCARCRRHEYEDDPFVRLDEFFYHYSCAPDWLTDPEPPEDLVDEPIREWGLAERPFAR